MSSVHARALRRAAEIVGGVGKLGAQWHVPVEELLNWLEGTRPVPEELFLRAVDIITEYDVEELSHSETTPSVLNLEVSKPH